MSTEPSASNRIDQAFADLAARGRKGLLPYVTAGLPDLQTTEAVLEALAGLGVTAVELGLPYSDPIADGPTIQASFTRALAGGVRIRDIMAMVARVRRRVDLPLLAMGSYSIVHRVGPERFAAMARDAGLDGLIIPDLSLEEAPQTAALLAGHGLRLPMLVAPTSGPQRRERIARTSTGFVYYMSVAGITGERAQLPPDLPEQVASLREVSRLPVVVGFGISTPEHVRLVCSVADGAIIGSALVRRMMEAQDAGAPRDRIVQLAADSVRQWMTGLD